MPPPRGGGIRRPSSFVVDTEGLDPSEFETGPEERKRLIYEPTDTDRDIVKRLARIGTPQDVIAGVLGVSQQTISLRFQHEVEFAKAEAIEQVATSLFNMATVDKNVAAAIFWLKTQAQWREKIDVNVTSEAKSMTDEELLAVAGKARGRRKIIDSSAEEIDDDED